MKNILLLLLLPLGLFAQKSAPIPKRASQIFIGNDKTAEENFAYVSKYLVQQGIDIANRDKELGTITTEVFKRGKLHPISLSFYCEDSSIRVTGRYKLGLEIKTRNFTATDDFEKIENRGMRGSVQNRTFQAMDEVASELGDMKVYN